MATTLRFTTTAQGSMEFTGNTLGVNGFYPDNGNPSGAIGALISTDLNQQVAGYQFGTTDNWTLDGSSAILELTPNTSRILHAELMWTALTSSSIPAQDTARNFVDNPVNLTLPDGSTVSVSPDPTTADPSLGSPAGQYYRTADVTNIVNAAGAGQYTLSAVPAALGSTGAWAGWILGVVYEDLTLPFRNMTLWTGFTNQNPNPPPIYIPISGFATPSSGPVGARILLGASEADPGGGDSVEFGETIGTLQPLSGPNNTPINFFASQINNGNSESPNVGLINTTGTFGTLNVPATGPNTKGYRYSHDITNVDGTGYLGNSVQNAVIGLPVSPGDGYFLNLLGLQIDVESADLEIIKSTDKVITELGETITYTLEVTNNGNVDSNNTIVTDPIPTGSIFVPNSVTINNSSQPGENPQNGINLGTLSPGETATITFEVIANALGTIDNTASVDFTFIPAPGLNPVTGSEISNTVSTIVTTAFNCEAFGYRVAATSSVTNSSLNQINLVTGAQTLINPDIGLNMNGIGYNTLDNFIYGIENRTNNLIIIDALGNTYNLGPVPNLPDPSPSNYNIGAIDDAGHLFIKNSGNSLYYVIDVDQSSPTFGQLVDPTANFILDTAPFGTAMNPNISFADWTFNSVDGNLYGAQSGTGNIVKVDPTTGTPSILATSGMPSSNFGSIYSLSDRFIYATDNNTGTIYRIEIIGNSATAVAFAQDVPSGFNDGTSCLDAVLEIDFGDAPDINPTSQGQGNYRTLLESNGPRHGIVNALTLGTQVTPEDNAYQSPDALGDDQILGVQDDGTTLPLTNMALNASSYTISESVFNNTGSPANVYAWIDFNKDGIFQTEEGTTAVVPSSGAPQTIDLTFTVPGGTTLTPGDTFVRVRVTTDTLSNTGQSNTEDTRSFGPATDGEVEDYLLTIEDTQIISTKSVDPAYADLGDTLTYTVTLTNPGTLPIDDVLFTDPLPNGVTYANNLSVDTSFSGTDPMTGLTITTINPGQTVTISWDVLIGDTLPNPNPIVNVGTVTIPTLPPTTTPEVETQVNNATLTITKSANKETVLVGETITYTIEVTNSGNVDANPAVVTDLMPPSTTYVAGTLLVNGAPNASDPNTGFDIGPVGPGETKTITFDVTVDENPTPLPFENTANVDYEYIVDPNEPPVSVTEPSNTVDVNVADIDIVKSVDKEYAQVGDNLTYTSVITNTGNAPLENIIFTDIPPSQTTYVSPSVKINNILYPSLNPNNPIDISIASPALLPLQPGNSLTISYKVSIDSLPDDPTILNTSSVEFEYTDGNETKTSSKDSNEVITEVREGEIEIIKTANKDVVLVGDTLRYTIEVKNTGNVEVLNVVLTDIVPTETSFVEGSVVVDGVNRPNDNPASGIDLGTIGVGDSVFVSFSVVVNELPASGQITNTASGSFEFIVDPNQPPVSETRDSNEVVTDVEELNISITKVCDPKQIVVGDEITYTFTITNNGTVDISNIKLFDTLSNGVELVSGSFIGSTQGSVSSNDLIDGVNIGSLNAGEEKQVSFKVVLIKQICPPVVCNTATITYEYELVAGEISTDSSDSNECCVEILTDTFKQIFKDGKLSIPDVKPNIESLLDLSVTPKVVSTETLDSPKGTSTDGQFLTGKKLLICIKFCITVTYVSENDDQSVHSAHFEISSCEYLVIPEGSCSECTNPNINIEDVYYEMINNRKVFYNITYLIDICC